MILTLEGVTKKFGALAAVNDLSFSVEEGEFFGIAGPNGAGKTTVFNLISGFYHGAGGILLDGKRIDGRPPHEVCRMGVARTFQLPMPFDSMTVRQNIAIGAHFGDRGTNTRRSWSDPDDLMGFLGLAERADSPVPTLKLYDKKLTVLAAALATRPRVLLLDEAVAGLSIVEAEQVLALFRRLNGEWGITVIMIEHLMGVLTRLCNRLLVMNNGEALHIGKPADVMEDALVQEVLLGVKRA